MNRYLEAMVLVPRGLRHLENPGTAMRHVLGLARGETVQYRLKSGPVFSLSTAPRDRPAIMSLEEVFGQHVYPVPAEGALCVVDAGAHVGFFSFYAAMQNKNARIFSYEAAGVTFARLRENLALNPEVGRRITPRHMAIAPVAGEVELFLDASSSRASSLVASHGRPAERVAACTLRDVFDQNQIERCDILKMDVESAEYGILYGAPGDVWKRIETIYVECHPCEALDPAWSLKSMAAFLKEKGFVRQEIVGIVIRAWREKK